MKKQIQKVLVLLSFVILLLACSKEDNTSITTEPSKFTVYKNQTGDNSADALQAQNTDSKGTLNFYGVFDSENNPKEIRTLTYQKTNNDTIVNLIIDPITNKLASSYFSVKGVKSPVVLKFDYIDGVANAYNLSYYNYNWENKTSELLYAARVETNNGVASSNPFFANRGGVNDGFKLIAQSLTIGFVTVKIIVPIVSGLITASATVIAAAVAAPIVTTAAVGAVLLFLIPKAGAAELDYTPSSSTPPSKTPIINPVPATGNPTSNLETSSCVNTNMTFRASMDFEGSILISEVAEGKAPYTYTTGSGFQQSQVFPNKYKDGSYVIGIKDANGCLSFKLVSLKRTIDCANSTFGITVTSLNNTATVSASGGLSPYTYSWSSGSTSVTATNLTSGTYTVTVTDKLGCTKTAEAIVVGPCDDTTTPYPTVAIGGQVWMQKNLNVCKYRNGDDIPQVQNSAAWNDLRTGAWCYYENNTANGPVYGKLYNWYAVNDPRGLAPIGYHVPAYAEWKTLTTYLGGQFEAGNKMKATTGWTPYTGITNTNSSGFTGLPAGFRSGNGLFELIGSYGFWWSSSSSEFDTRYAWNGYLNYSNANTIPDYGGYKGNGFSVRCIRD